MEDKILSHIEEDRYSDIKYHLICLKPYLLRAGRSKKRTDHPIDERSTVQPNDTSSVDLLISPRSKRRRSQDTNVCIICDKPRLKADANLYRICEAKRAKVFLSAMNYNLDDVYTRCSTYKTVERIFAADIVSHKSCMNLYLLNYQRKMEEIMK